MNTHPIEKNKKKLTFDLRSMNSISRAVILILLGAVISFLSPYFLTSSNLINVLAMTSVPIILAFGEMIVMLTGNIDLSIGATMSIASVVTALLIKFVELPYPLAILAGLMVGGVMGLFNGILISKVKLPSFIATYGLMVAITGFSIAILKGYVVYGYPESYRFLGVGRLGGIPFIIFIMLAVVGIVWVILNRTTFGRRIYALGANKEAARMSGINIDRTVTAVYVVSGVLSAFAGIIQVSRINSAQSTLGAALLLPAIAAVVIGGTSIFGGEGRVIGTIIGALIMNVIQNGLNLIGAPSILQQFIVGLIILIAVIIDKSVRQVITNKLR